ncbi:type IV secretion system DNA-binding domain-containing protein, partial [Escherichia coli]|uniref:type IV secretion system DNA-binding domain-containing protein n=1 Tax=Escherichia coli TaxID=562 RepID=UPI003DA04037
MAVAVPSLLPVSFSAPARSPLPEARKFGGCYVFGIQSYAQLEDIYGEKAAATLFDVMNTRA